ncbi:MAG: glycoside hydrolase family 3 N-terminal domain-containing protein, partial [Clostridia bacterium]
EACVQALLAGCDMLLLPKNFTNGYKGVVKALQEGRLTEERVNESVLRILRVKEAAGLLE